MGNRVDIGWLFLHDGWFINKGSVVDSAVASSLILGLKREISMEMEIPIMMVVHLAL